MTTLFAMLVLLVIRIALPLIILLGIGEIIQRITAKPRLISPGEIR